VSAAGWVEEVSADERVGRTSDHDLLRPWL